MDVYPVMPFLQGLFYCQDLTDADVIISLCWSKEPGEEGTGMEFHATGGALGQSCSNSNIRW